MSCGLVSREMRYRDYPPHVAQLCRRPRAQAHTASTRFEYETNVGCWIGHGVTSPIRRTLRVKVDHFEK